MPKSKTTPFLVIIVGVLVAGGLAMYLSRQGSTSAGLTDAGSMTAQTGHVRGAPDAMISLIEYGDYQCPACGQYHPILKELLNRYPGKFKLEYRHFPLVQIHPNAMGAALAAEAAAEQGKFWEMHDLLFDRQREWGDVRQPPPSAEAVFVQYALEIGLDSNTFMQSIRSPATRDRVLADVTRGNAVVKSTPTFILDGQVLADPQSMEWFVDYIERRLATPAQSSK